MTFLQRQRVLWTGFSGAPGVSTFYFIDAAAHQSSLRTFLASLTGYLPDTVTMTIEPVGDQIEDTTGALVGAWGGSTPDPVVGTVSGNYSAASGFLVRWDTLTIVAGSRVDGRTYFVPCASAAYDNGGTLNNTILAPIKASAEDFINSPAGNFKVWSRPRAATPEWTGPDGRVHPAKSARSGATAQPTGATVSDRVVVLRSRRD